MKWAAVLVLVACGASSGGIAVDGFDIVVSSTDVAVWAGFTGTVPTNAHFAAPGTCGGTTDAIVIMENCFGGIVLDGTPLPSADSHGPVNPYMAMRAITADATFTATACGNSIEVPLHPHAVPRIATASATRSGNDIVLAWSTDAPYTIASMGGGYGQVDCNDAGATQHVFAGWSSGSSFLTAAVRPLSAPEITQTDLGEVRVWYGDVTPITVPPP